MKKIECRLLHFVLALLRVKSGALYLSVVENSISLAIDTHYVIVVYARHIVNYVVNTQRPCNYSLASFFG